MGTVYQGTKSRHQYLTHPFPDVVNQISLFMCGFAENTLLLNRGKYDGGNLAGSEDIASSSDRFHGRSVSLKAPPPLCHCGIFLMGLPSGSQPLESGHMGRLEASALAMKQLVDVLSLTPATPDIVISSVSPMEL